MAFAAERQLVKVGPWHQRMQTSTGALLDKERRRDVEGRGWNRDENVPEHKIWLVWPMVTA